MSSAPPRSVVSAIENGVAQVTRRMEIYESDGVTQWFPDFANDPTTDRLVGGNISVDYSSDERRKADMTLRNDDLLLRLNPNGGFYYDKIIKVFRGVKYNLFSTRPRIAVIESDGTYGVFASNIRMLGSAGYPADDKRSITTYAEVADYDILVIITQTALATKHAILKEHFANGKTVLTVGFNNTATQVPHIVTGSGYAGNWGVVPIATKDQPLLGKIPASTGVIANATGVHVTGVTSRGIPIAANQYSTSNLAITLGTNAVGGLWFDYRVPNLYIQSTTQAQILQAMFDYLWTRNKTSGLWERQMGEFMIDGANDSIFPNQVKLTTRDYTKKLLKDKLTFTSSFPAGTSLRTFVRAIASNGGITKFREAIGDEVFPNEIVYERDTDRWKILKEVCTAFDYEIYFDNQGYLAVRKFLDPTLSPISHTFLTGTSGNLVGYDRAVNDSRIFNIINIFGDPVSNDRLPYFGQAVNDDPASPTSTVNLGNRPWTFAANYFASDAECLDLARSRLKIMGLESYEINYSSIYYPWLEAGEIIQILDPHRNGTDPIRFLMDSISFPIELGPMSGTGKRVTIVGSSG